jgi:hypothetical protein
MTASGTEEPTIGIDQTAALTAARGGVAAVSTDDASGVTSSGWWVGPAEDPDRYELLGTGIMGGEGTTFQARYHGAAGEPLTIAVKQLHRPSGESPAWPRPDDWARWRDQLHIIHQVRNEHLVQVRAIFAGAPPHRPGTADRSSSGGQFEIPYVVMEWIPGPTLDQRIRSAPAAVRLRLRVAWISHLKIFNW